MYTKMKMKIMKMNMNMKMKMMIIKQQIKIKLKKLNDYLDKITDKPKSFDDQIKLLKKREDLKKYYPHKDYDDKEVKYKHFKIKLAEMSNEIDKKLFEKIFGHTLIKLADKLINTANKEENQIIVKNSIANKIKLDKREKTMPYNWVISQVIDLLI